MRAFIYMIFGLSYLAVTFFGLGPVFMADGSTQERMFTLAVVILIYIFLTCMLFVYRERSKRKKAL